MSRPIAYGIDFGTSNSSISVAYDDGAELGVVNDRGATVMPSIVYIDSTHNELAGDDAVENYLAFAADASRARLMSSLKTYLTDRNLMQTTSAWGQTHTIPELVAIILRQLKLANDQRLGANIRRVVLGHPVLFAGAAGPTFEELQDHALEKLDKAARIAGFDEVAFFDEPTAALMGEELERGVILAVDFGGGTFDVSVIELTPESGEVLSMHGAAVGGELFDSLLFDAKVGPALHLDQQYLIDGKRMSVPVAIRRMRTLYEIVGMVGSTATRDAFSLMRRADGHPLEMVEEIIYGGHAYNFFRSIEAAKIELSSEQGATIAFRRPRVSLSVPVQRSEFSTLIRRNLDAVDDQIDRALIDSNLAASDVDLVIRTGGSSRIPAFVERLTERFGAAKLAERDAFSTVALGLGIRACEVWG